MTSAKRSYEVPASSHPSLPSSPALNLHPAAGSAACPPGWGSYEFLDSRLHRNFLRGVSELSEYNSKGGSHLYSLVTGLTPFLVASLARPSSLVRLPGQVTMKTTQLGAYAVVSQSMVMAVPSCSVETFQNVLPSNATILSAVAVANGSTYGEGAANIAYPTNPTNLPANCALTVNVTSSASSSFRFGIFLPTQWNGRFMTVGNGGFSGGINWLDMGAGIRYGFAIVSTDTGHNATTSDGTWALNAPERRADFGYRAIHGSTVMGKALTEAYYGQNISWSYYAGSSTGGRQGLREAQYDPDSFDGLLVGAPAWWTSHLQPWTTKLATYNLPVDGANRIPPAMFSTIGDEATRQCDAVDGVVDGIVSAPEECQFDPSTLQCGSGLQGATGNATTACLTTEQMVTLKNIYADYYAEGKFAFPGLEPGSESQWSVLLGGTAPNGLGDGYMQYFLLNDPSWNYTQYTDSIIWEADAADPGNATADHYEAMAAVMERGSKV